jgi:Protein of unknown function (DUF1569)
MILREKRSSGKRKGIVPLRRFKGRIAAVHPKAGGTWLCVQHEEDGANARNWNARTADAWKPHPMFGKMTAKEWGKLLQIHVDYHLRQFAA